MSTVLAAKIEKHNIMLLTIRHSNNSIYRYSCHAES